MIVNYLSDINGRNVFYVVYLVCFMSHAIFFEREKGLVLDVEYMSRHIFQTELRRFGAFTLELTYTLIIVAAIIVILHFWLDSYDELHV